MRKALNDRKGVKKRSFFLSELAFRMGADLSHVAENFSSISLKLPEEQRGALASYEQSEKLLQILFEKALMQRTVKVSFLSLYFSLGRRWTLLDSYLLRSHPSMILLSILNQHQRRVRSNSSEANILLCYHAWTFQNV